MSAPVKKQLAAELAQVLVPRVSSVKKRSRDDALVEETVAPALRTLVISSDGACTANGTARAAGGCGVFARDGAFKWSGRCSGKQTNQRAELFAGIVAAAYATFKCKEESIAVHSDSEYVVLGMIEESRLRTWARNGWKTKARTPVANEDLWRIMHALHVRKPLKWAWVKGHSGVAGNEAADKLAGDAVKAFAVPKTLHDAWPTELLGISLKDLLEEQ
jgi:ribonuclease HI